MEKQDLFEALGNKTRLKVLCILAQKSMTLSQTFKALPELHYRSSASRVLQRLLKAGLIKRKFDNKISGYKYSPTFKSIKITDKIRLQNK